MTPNIQRIAARANRLIMCGLIGWGLFMLSSPLHPAPNDSHHGLMAIAPGFLLFLLSFLTYAAGQLLRRLSAWDNIVAAGFSAIVLALTIFFAMS